MGLGKKGFLFTLLAILIAVFINVIYASLHETPIDQRTILIQTRMESLNYYADSFFVYAQGTAIISGRQALMGMIRDVNNVGYNPNFEAEYSMCVSVGNQTPSKICHGMADKTLKYYLDIFQNMGIEQMKIKSVYTINSIQVLQISDPFTLDLFVNLTLNISDGFANISQTKVVLSQFNITGFNDPLYIRGRIYNQTIQRFNISKKEGTWNATDLQELYLMGHYRNDNSSISFINRMKGNFTAGQMGIESIIDHTRVSFTPNQSMIDYLYWGGINFSCTARTIINITGSTIPLIPTNIPFQLDDRHRLIFNISSSEVQWTC